LFPVKREFTKPNPPGSNADERFSRMRSKRAAPASEIGPSYWQRAGALWAGALALQWLERSKVIFYWIFIVHFWAISAAAEAPLRLFCYRPAISVDNLISGLPRGGR